MSKASHYLKVYVGTMLMTGIILVVFVYVADPYSLFGSRLASSISSKKFLVSSFERLSKPVIVCRVRPDAVILGTSRAAVGLRPNTLTKYVGSSYNFGLNGAYLLEIDAALRIAVKCGARFVLYGLDFFTFTEHTEKKARQVRVMGSGYTLNKVEILLKNVISISALKDSFRTIWGNLRNDAPSHDESGMLVKYNPDNVPFQAPDAEQRLIFADAYKTFEAMLLFAEEAGVDMKIFISPTYQSHLRTDPVYLDWLNRVTKIAGNHGVTIHNLAGHSEYSGSRSTFHDVSHFKPALGDRIIETLYEAN